jgi:hypothetical protein
MAQKAKSKNPAAVALGRLGGAKKVKKGFAMLTLAQRRATAMKGVEARRANAGERGSAAAKNAAGKKIISARKRE